MDKLFNKLPEDIQILIISYIKYPQKSELLEDIRNYKIIKDKLYDKYKNNFININNFTNGEYNELIDMAVTLNIENNLLGYINSEIIYNLYKSLKNIKIMERMLCFRIKREYNGENKTMNQIHINMNINIKSRINRYLGSLTINEREIFLNRKKRDKIYKIYN